MTKSTNVDMRVQLSFASHPKKIKLDRRLGAQGVLSLIWLWGHTAQNRPNGRLVDMDVEDIEIAAQWDGEPGKLTWSTFL